MNRRFILKRSSAASSPYVTPVGALAHAPLAIDTALTAAPLYLCVRSVRVAATGGRDVTACTEPANRTRPTPSGLATPEPLRLLSDSARFPLAVFLRRVLRECCGPSGVLLRSSDTVFTSPARGVFLAADPRFSVGREMRTAVLQAACALLSLALLALAAPQACVKNNYQCLTNSECCGGCCSQEKCVEYSDSCIVRQNPCSGHSCPGSKVCFLNPVQCAAPPCAPLPACKDPDYDDYS
ncbi:uncharacterized protein LOC134530023 [Bacillus rossius redtenbacheri]|uniref:uncharacterized protein LOC134530023 n=1 Tax=Bacillus rossius redtenbacheri TaxID=93214 RepID=UPI002FDCEAF1